MFNFKKYKVISLISSCYVITLVVYFASTSMIDVYSVIAVNKSIMGALGFTIAATLAILGFLFSLRFIMDIDKKPIISKTQKCLVYIALIFLSIYLIVIFYTIRIESLI